MIEQDDEYEAYKKNLLEQVNALLPDASLQQKVEKFYEQMAAPAVLGSLIDTYKDSIAEFIGEIDDKAIVKHFIEGFVADLQAMIAPNDKKEDDIE